MADDQNHLEPGAAGRLAVLIAEMRRLRIEVALLKQSAVTLSAGIDTSGQALAASAEVATARLSALSVVVESIATEQRRQAVQQDHIIAALGNLFEGVTAIYELLTTPPEQSSEAESNPSTIVEGLRQDAKPGQSAESETSSKNFGDVPHRGESEKSSPTIVGDVPRQAESKKSPKIFGDLSDQAEPKRESSSVNAATAVLATVAAALVESSSAAAEAAATAPEPAAPSYEPSPSPSPNISAGGGDAGGGAGGSW